MVCWKCWPGDILLNVLREGFKTSHLETFESVATVIFSIRVKGGVFKFWSWVHSTQLSF